MYKVISVYFLVVIVCISSCGQTVDSDKFVLGIYYSPNISYRALSNSNITKLRDNSEENKYGSSVGFTFGYHILQFISIETGLQFSSRGFQTKFEFLKFAEPDTFMPENVGMLDNFYYLSIPIKLEFSKEFSKFIIFSSTGLISNILLRQNQEYNVTYKDRKETFLYNHTNDFRKITLMSVFSIGFAYKYTNNILILMEPTFQHDIISVIDAPLKTYLWDLGLKIGIKYKI
jgi:hypothetical protein